MIARISGLLIEKNPLQIVIDCQGIGYEVAVPMNTFYHLPGIGEKIILLTHLIIREDAHTLYGFASHEERHVFKLLIKISGVGARTALAILSGLSVQDLTHAVALQEAGRLTKVPGIGKKTAERLLLELKGKLSEAKFDPQRNTGGDILSALIALGYSEKEARQAIQSLSPELSVSEGIKFALKALSKL